MVNFVPYSSSEGSLTPNTARYRRVTVFTVCRYTEKWHAVSKKPWLSTSLYDIMLLKGIMELFVLERTQLNAVEHKTDTPLMQLLLKSSTNKYRKCNWHRTYHIIVNNDIEKSRNSSYASTTIIAVRKNKGQFLRFALANWWNYVLD